jgi:uncharacterized membrane protein YkoI
MVTINIQFNAYILDLLENNNMENRKEVTIPIFLIAAATLTISSVISMSDFGIGDANAQSGMNMSMTDNQNMSNVNNNTMFNSSSSSYNITSSINMKSLIGQAIASQVKVSLTNASSIAEQSVGPNSHAIKAELDMKKEYLTYRIVVVDNNFEMHKVVVDPGNGEVLFTGPLSKWDKMSMMMGPQIEPDLIMLGAIDEGSLIDPPGLMMMDPGMMMALGDDGIRDPNN